MSEMKLALIRIDGGTQARAEINSEVVAEYTEAIKGGARFPPLDVFFDGKEYWLAEGFHRWHALQAAGKKTHEVVIRKGTKEAAQWFACAANGKHGLRRSHADKRESVRMALAHPIGQKASLRELSEYLNIPKSTIDDLKRELSGSDSRPNETAAESAAPPPAAASEAPKSGSPGQPDKSAPKPPAPPAEPLDSVGQVIPEKLRPMFARRQEITGRMGELSTIKATVLKAFEDRDPLYYNLSQSRFLAAMKNARAELDCCLPFAICGYCKGRGCKACRTQGWVDEIRYKAQPPEMKGAKHG